MADFWAQRACEDEYLLMSIKAAVGTTSNGTASDGTTSDGTTSNGNSTDGTSYSTPLKRKSSRPRSASQESPDIVVAGKKVARRCTARGDVVRWE